MSLATLERAIRTDAVAIYVRWSTDEQGEGTTLQEQMERCRSYVQSQGWRVTDSLLFVDEGYSGASLERPAITRLRDEVRKGNVDCVVSLKIDRLSRSLVDSVDLVLREWSGVCYYKSVSQPINTTDELGRVFFAILAGFAEYERALIRERTTSGLIRRVREGVYWGSGKAPFGYSRVDKGKLAVNEAEAPTVRLIFDLAVRDALGPGAIAARLNEMRIPAPAGQGWWTYTVRSVLRNRTYVGFPEYGKRVIDVRKKTAGGNPVLLKRAKPLVVLDGRRPELVLVDDDTFAAAQKLLRERSERVKAEGTGPRSHHLLSGLVRCRCGAPMITGYDAGGRRYYYCQGRDRSRGGAGCVSGGGFVYADQVEPAVAGAVQERFGAVDLEPRLAEQWHRQSGAASASTEVHQARIAELARQEKHLEEDLARIVRQARRGEISLAEKREFEADLERERHDLANQRAGLEQLVQAVWGTREQFEELVAWVSRVGRWEALELEGRRELLRHVMERVEVFKPKGRGKQVELDVFWRV